MCDQGYTGSGVVCNGILTYRLFSILYKMSSHQILMSVLMLPLITVTLMLTVPTLLGASSVHVTKDTLEMEPLAQVLS